MKRKATKTKPVGADLDRLHPLDEVLVEMLWVEGQARMWIGRRASAKRTAAIRELSLRAGQLLRDYERLEHSLT